jgi:hypothetical protein
MNEDTTTTLVNYPPEEILDCTIKGLVEYSDDIGFYLPYQWSNAGDDRFKPSDGIGNPCPDDPLTIYWTADLTGGDERITYKTTLGLLLDDVFEGHKLFRTPEVICPTSVPIFVHMRDALQKEIARLNVWIDNAATKENEE